MSQGGTSTSALFYHLDGLVSFPTEPSMCYRPRSRSSSVWRQRQVERPDFTLLQRKAHRQSPTHAHAACRSPPGGLLEADHTRESGFHTTVKVRMSLRQAAGRHPRDPRRSATRDPDGPAAASAGITESDQHEYSQPPNRNTMVPGVAVTAKDTSHAHFSHNRLCG